MRYAVGALQSVLSADFKSSEIEACVLKDNGRVQILSEEDIDHHLTVLAETDL